MSVCSVLAQDEKNGNTQKSGSSHRKSATEEEDKTGENVKKLNFFVINYPVVEGSQVS